VPGALTATSQTRRISSNPVPIEILELNKPVLPDAAKVTKNMSQKIKIKWLSKPEEHDYPAALSYLTLIYDEKTAAGLVKKLKRAPMSEFKAKDIFRAARLPLLGAGNSHVKKDMVKIESGRGVSPLLLVRDSANGKVVIADGYHRICAVYTFDEDAVIPCKLA
jgi:hypothetical protein